MSDLRAAAGLAQTKSAVKSKAHAKTKTHAKGHNKENRDWGALAGRAAAAANNALN